MTFTPSKLSSLGAISGALAVMIGAFGAHGLEGHCLYNWLGFTRRRPLEKPQINEGLLSGLFDEGSLLCTVSWQI